MNIQSIQTTNKFQHAAFTGISKVMSNKFIERINCGGDQGDLDIYEKTIEYRPFKDDTLEEVNSEVQSIKSQNVHDDSTSYTEVKILIGKPLDCTKEAAKYIIDSIG